MQERLELITEIFITAHDFKKMAKEDYRTDVEGLENFGHGEFLARKLNQETGEVTVYRLKNRWMHSFDLNYSANPKIKSGSELLISNFELHTEALSLLKNVKEIRA